MLNIKGAFVVIGSTAPRAVLLSASAYALYQDRIAVVGFEKATAYTFGHTATHALPCTEDCMEAMALNFVGAFQDKVRQICARIALRKPLGDDSDGSGGQGARIDTPAPKPSPSSGIAFPFDVPPFDKLVGAQS